MLVSRRSLVAGAAAATLSSRASAQGDRGQVDVVIVGAGAAGIAAARRLRGRERSVLILEARDRVGGRAWTESASLGIPFDQGAGWLHNADVNPLVPIARQNNVNTRISGREDAWLYQCGIRSPRRDVDAYIAAEERLYEIGARLAARGRDGSLADAAGANLWRRLVASQISAGDIGADPRDISLLDLMDLNAEGDDLMVQGGVGAFIASLAANLPIQLGAPIRGLDWNGAGVSVSGGFGVLRARAAIVTAPAGVIANGGIRFAPELPVDVMSAFTRLRMGLLTKIAFRSSAPLIGYPEYAAGLTEMRLGRANVVHIDPASRVATILTGGSLARGLSEAGEPALLDFGRAVVRDIFGSRALGAITRSTATQWDRDPFALGAYAVPRPGDVDARAVYQRVLADGRLAFAGEAGGGDLSMTVGGAWRSGVAVADRVDEALG